MVKKDILQDKFVYSLALIMLGFFWYQKDGYGMLLGLAIMLYWRFTR